MALSTGNSWDPKVVYSCTWCGIGKLCKTCHRHGNERGKCSECPQEKDIPPFKES